MLKFVCNDCADCADGVPNKVHCGEPGKATKNCDCQHRGSK